jgi:hypothetical protein
MGPCTPERPADLVGATSVGYPRERCAAFSWLDRQMSQYLLAFFTHVIGKYLIE